MTFPALLLTALVVVLLSVLLLVARDLVTGRRPILDLHPRARRAAHKRGGE